MYPGPGTMAAALVAVTAAMVVVAGMAAAGRVTMGWAMVMAVMVMVVGTVMVVVGTVLVVWGGQ